MKFSLSYLVHPPPLMCWWSLRKCSNDLFLMLFHCLLTADLAVCSITIMHHWIWSFLGIFWVCLNMKLKNSGVGQLFNSVSDMKTQSFTVHNSVFPLVFWRLWLLVLTEILPCLCFFSTGPLLHYISGGSSTALHLYPSHLPISSCLFSSFKSCCHCFIFLSAFSLNSDI